MDSYNLSLYRSWFPHLATGKIWLNHAAISPLSTRVNHAVRQYLENRTTGEIDVYASSVATAERVKRNLSSMIGATPDRIGFVPNTSDGLGLLAAGLAWKSGDRVLLNDSEFPANVVPFLNQKKHGIEIDFVKNVNGEISVEEIERLITPKTRVLSISSVQFLSGYFADLVSIGELCKRRGIVFCVDGIQGTGVSPLDVRSMHIDFLSNGGHKWLMGLMGLGFVFVTEELQQEIRQANVGWTSNKNFFGDFFRYRIDLDETARRYENGTQNYAAIAALEASTTILLEVGVENIRKHVLHLTGSLINFADAEGYDILTPRDDDRRAGIVSFRCPNSQEVFDTLTEWRITTSLREQYIRISPHFYNSPEEIGTLCTALHSLR